MPRLSCLWKLMPQLCAILDLFSLMTSLARLFPLFASEIVEHSAHGRLGGSWAMLSVELYTSEPIRRQVRKIYRRGEKSHVSSSVPAPPLAVPGRRAANDTANGSAAAATGGVQRRRPIPVLPKEVHEMMMATGGLDIEPRPGADRSVGARGGAAGTSVSGEEEEEWSEEADWCTRELGCAVASLGEALCLYARGDDMG